jgi:type IV pilus assembly protein PilP
MKRVTKSRKGLALGLALFAASPGLLLACGETPVQKGPAGPPPSASTLASASPSGSIGPTLKGLDYTENDFVENENNRDPFRSYASGIGNANIKQPVNQRKVYLGEFAVDELKLMAIVLSSDGNRAMLIPPGGKGTTIMRGDYIGRAEVVHIGGANGPEYQLNWRVDKIREGDVVLIREDPAQPAIPPATRVILLHPENEKAGRPG